MQQSPPPNHSNCLEFPGFRESFKPQNNLGSGSKVPMGNFLK
jgi:hypothetical protein